MSKSTKSATKSNLLKKLSIIAGLTLLWLGLTFFYISTFESFSIIPYNHQGVLSKYVDEPLLKNQKIEGEFRASENNLGIISMRFELRSRIPFSQEDDLTFRLKEKGSSDWYFTGEYKSGLTYDVPFLPFGFPIIPDSKDKVYEFELKSLRGNPRNALIVSNQYPNLQSKYAIDLGKLKSDPILLLKFLRQKYIGAFDNPSVIFSSIIYALPLLFYLIAISSLSKKVKKRNLKFIFMGTILIFILFDIFIIQIINDSLYILLMLLWIYLMRKSKSDERITFGVSLSILILTAFTNTLMLEAIAEKSAAWAFMFLIAGTIQIASALRNDK